MYKKIIFLIFILIIFIFLFYFIKHINKTKYDFYNYLCIESKEKFFKEKKINGRIKVLPNRKYSSNFSFYKEKSKLRVFLMGESLAHILHTPDGVFDNNHKIEFINLGMSGYDIKRVFNVFNESLKYNPDIIILMSSNNETGIDMCSLKRNKKIKNLKNIEEEYKENIRKIIQISKDKNIKLFISILPRNLFYPPYGSLPENDNFLKGFQDFIEKKYYLAKEKFLISYNQNNEDPFFSYYLGLTYFNLKNNKEALKYLNKAIDNDIRKDRATKERNDFLRSLEDKKNIFTIDFEDFFKQKAKSDINFEKFLIDGVHWKNKKIKNIIEEFILLKLFYFTKNQDINFELIKQKEIVINNKKDKSKNNEYLDYALTYISFNEDMDERIIYMLNKAVDEKIINENTEKEGIILKIKNNFWINIKNDSKLWWNKYLFFLSSTYFRKQEYTKSKIIIKKINPNDFDDNFNKKYNKLYKNISLKTNSSK